MLEGHTVSVTMAQKTFQRQGLVYKQDYEQRSMVCACTSHNTYPLLQEPHLGLFLPMLSSVPVQGGGCNAGPVLLQVHQAELSSSQDVLPKRRKISEPKEQF